jgi:type I restriction enzyme S subunit
MPLFSAFEGRGGPLRDRIAHNERQAASLAAIRDALLPKLLSGEIRLKNAEAIVTRRTASPVTGVLA